MYSVPSAQALPHARLALSAGVQTMRARICSVFSCDMFARVVWLKSWGAAKLPTFALPFTARACHAWLARLTRARRGGSEGGRRKSSLLTFGILRLGDAVQRWLRHPEPSSSSQKSTIKEKYLYVSSLSEFFSLVRKERKGQKEECFPLLNTFCRLAATGANTLPRPSGNC